MHLYAFIGDESRFWMLYPDRAGGGSSHGEDACTGTSCTASDRARSCYDPGQTPAASGRPGPAAGGGGEGGGTL